MTWTSQTGRHTLSRGQTDFVISRYINFYVDRKFVVLQGFFPDKMKQVYGYKPNISNRELYRNCVNLPYCEGYSKSGNYLFQYEKIKFQKFTNDSAWTTVLPINMALLHPRQSGNPLSRHHRQQVDFTMFLSRHQPLLSTN